MAFPDAPWRLESAAAQKCNGGFVAADGPPLAFRFSAPAALSVLTAACWPVEGSMLGMLSGPLVRQPSSVCRWGGAPPPPLPPPPHQRPFGIVLLAAGLHELRCSGGSRRTQTQSPVCDREGVREARLQHEHSAGCLCCPAKWAFCPKLTLMQHMAWQPQRNKHGRLSLFAVTSLLYGSCL